jgi:hypothetical protein
MILFYSPHDAREAAGLLRGCTKLKGDGRAIEVGVLESPFKPAGWIGAAEAADTRGGAGMSGADLSAAIGSLGASDKALVVLSHENMNKVREVSRTDLLAVVEGGVPFGAFIEEAAGAGLYFPHEPDALMSGATVAELIMDGTIFATEGRFGGLREYILSLEIVTPAGEIIKTGSRSIKDVAGYDIPGLVLGSGGLCGMISSVTFRLLPARGTRLHFACMETDAVLRSAVPEIHRELDPVFMEIFGEKGSALLAEKLRMKVPSGGRLLVGELQAAEKGREKELLDKLRRYFPASEAVSRLEPAQVEEHRRYPLIALESVEKGYSLLHLSYDETGAIETTLRSINSVTLYPHRFHFYSPYKVDNEGAPKEEQAFACSREFDEYLIAVLGSALTSGMEAGPSLLSQAVSSRGAMEVLGWSNERLCRRRVDIDVLGLRGEEGAGTGGRAGGAASAIDGRAKQQQILGDIADRIFDAFDPQGIMIR